MNAVAFSPDGKLLATASADGHVQLWNPATRQAVRALPSAGLGSGVNGVAFSRDGKLLATASADGYVRLWNPATGQAVGAALPADANSDFGVNRVAFSPDGKLLATAGGDGLVELWNLATRQPAGDPIRAGVSSGVNEVAFSPDGKLLATASADGVQLWYPATRQAVGTFVQAETPLRIAVPRASTNPDFGPTWVAFSADGKLLATVSGNGTVQTWQMSEFANPHAALCADVGLPTKAEWAKYAPGESQPSVCR